MTNRPVFLIALGMLLGIVVIGVFLAMLNGDAFASDTRLLSNGDIVVKLNRVAAHESSSPLAASSDISAVTPVAGNSSSQPSGNLNAAGKLLNERVDGFQTRLGEALDRTRGTPIAGIASSPTVATANRRDVATQAAPTVTPVPTVVIAAATESPLPPTATTAPPPPPPAPAASPVARVAPPTQPSTPTPPPPPTATPLPPTANPIAALPVPTLTPRFVAPALPLPTRIIATQVPRVRPTQLPERPVVRPTLTPTPDEPRVRPTREPATPTPTRQASPIAVIPPTLTMRDWLATRVAQPNDPPEPVPTPTQVRPTRQPEATPIPRPNRTPEPVGTRRPRP